MATREPGRRAASGESDWLTLGHAAKFLGVAQSTIRKWSDVGRVPAFYTPGGHRRYKRGDLEAFLERSGPGKPARGPLVLACTHCMSPCFMVPSCSPRQPVMLPQSASNATMRTIFPDNDIMIILS